MEQPNTVVVFCTKMIGKSVRDGGTFGFYIIFSKTLLKRSMARFTKTISLLIVEFIAI